MSEQIIIRSEIDKRNTLLCRFVVERTLFIGTKTISSKAEAQGFPLAEKLFEIDGVNKIELIGHLLVVTKSNDREWEEISERVEAVLTAYFVSGLALTREQVE